MYGIIYGVIRFFIEGNFRPDAWTIGGVPTAQYVSIISIVVFGCIMFVRHKLSRPSMLYVPGEPWQAPQDEEPKPVDEPETEASATPPVDEA